MEAKYLLQASGATAMPIKREPAATWDEKAAEINYLMVTCGIGPDEWMGWTIDQIVLFLRERTRRSHENAQRLSAHMQQAGQMKHDHIVRFVVPFEE